MEHKIKDSNSVIEKGSWKNEKQNVVILLKLICSLSDWRCWPSFRVSINFSSCDDENEAWKTKCAHRRIMPQEESFVASKYFYIQLYSPAQKLYIIFIYICTKKRTLSNLHILFTSKSINIIDNSFI